MRYTACMFQWFLEFLWLLHRWLAGAHYLKGSKMCHPAVPPLSKPDGRNTCLIFRQNSANDSVHTQAEQHTAGSCTPELKI
jgi:hypothetical protein